MIFSIITIFTMTTIILVMSVVHVEMNKSNVGYQELICQETDMDCFKLLCPQGWGWVKEKEECDILDGKRHISLKIWLYHPLQVTHAVPATSTCVALAS